MVLRAGRDDDFPELIAVWRSSVDATHDFVTPQDLLEMEREVIPGFLPRLDLTIATVDDRVVGFAGSDGEVLEMLFVHDDFRGHGIGSVLLSRVVEGGVRELQVNEDNADSVAFYRNRGFDVVRRTELDDAGRPYPTLHMRLAD
ncbi:GNAT family N-acetyltransferase [Tessaracoccus coleopterorum]|uniref:GNAT family N-acetyltransferase n=1 Tax=Tessaracoccus coleopterorum TaxID=2714950 RepID=UPI0018D28FE8